MFGYIHGSIMYAGIQQELYYVQSTLALRPPRYYGHPAKSPAKPIINYIAEALAIADSHYYGIADTLCGPEQTFLLFYSRYNGHLGSIFL